MTNLESKLLIILLESATTDQLSAVVRLCSHRIRELESEAKYRGRPGAQPSAELAEVIRLDLNRAEILVFAVISEHESLQITLADFAEVVKISVDHVAKTLRALQKRGLVNVVGDRGLRVIMATEKKLSVSIGGAS